MSTRHKVFWMFNFSVGLIIWLKGESATLNASRYLWEHSVLSVLSLLIFLIVYEKKAEANDSGRHELFHKIAVLQCQELADRVKTCKALRHDFINHLQVIYGMVQTDKLELLPDYIKKVSQSMAFEQQLSMLLQGDFYRMIHAGMVTALSYSLDFTFSVKGNDTWAGFSEYGSEKVMCLKILIQNLMRTLADRPEEDRRIKIILEPLPGSDRIEILVPFADSKEIVRLSDGVKELVGWNTDINLQVVWTSVLDGQMNIAAGSGSDFLITLISPRPTD